MTKTFKRYMSLLLLLVMSIMTAFPAEAFAAESERKIKYQYVDPPIFNPNTGETVKIVWNFERGHQTKITVFKGDDKEEKSPLFDIINGDSFGGDFIRNEIIWDGRDNNGAILPNGTYRIKIHPIESDKDTKYASRANVTITDSVSDFIAIDPNFGGDKFKVHGLAEKDMTDSVIVNVEYKNPDKQKENTSYEAEITGTTWSTKISLLDYEEADITAIKTVKVPKEAMDEQGNPILDAEGNPVITYEEQEIKLGPINVLKHVVRPFDRLPLLAGHYYKNKNEYTRIVEDNYLSPPYVLPIGHQLLVFDPIKNGQPPTSDDTDSGNMSEKCGIVDLMTGKTVFGGDPVNLATGNFIYSHEDIGIDGGFPIYFNRYYNSIDKFNGTVGINWHHDWEYELQDMGDGTVKIISFDGKRQIYTQTGDGEYEPPTGVYDKLEKHSDGTYTLTMENKWKYDFNETGELARITDTNDNKIELFYENMLLREIRNDSGYLLIQYNDDGRIRQISDSTGRYVAYTYEGNDLASYRDPEGNIIEYQYDSEHRMTRIISPLRNESVTNIYDDKGRVIEQTLADGNTMYFQYDEANRTTTYTEKDGTKIIYKYDEEFRITDKIYPDGAVKITFNERGDRTSYTDKKGNTYLYEHDDDGNLTKVTDPEGNVTMYTYDEFHNITSITQPDGIVYNYIYDAKGNLVKVKDSMNRTTEIIYNAKGFPEKVIQPNGSHIKMEYDEKGNLRAVLDPLGNKVRYEYDSLNRVSNVIDPLGNKTIFEYTNTGDIKKVTDAEGNSGTFIYNPNGLLEEVLDQNGNVTKYKYNKADQLTEIIDPTNGTTSFEYDKMGNIAKTTDANGNTYTYGYDKLNHLVSITDPEQYTYKYEYDPNGNVTKSIDPSGNSTVYEYDSLNRLVSITNANQGQIKYEYDSIGRIRKTTNPLEHTREYEYYDDSAIKTVTDEMGNATSFTYNDLGLVETITEPNGAVTEYRYNSLGNLTEVIDAEGATTKWEYDGNGNVTKVIDSLGNVSSYTYDKINRIKTITNALGNMRKFQYTKMGQVASITDENDNTTYYTYDAVGNLIEVIDPLGNSTKYVYDKIGNLTEVQQYRKVSDETLSSVTNVGLLSKESIDGNQTVTEEVYSEDTTEEIPKVELLSGEKEQTVTEKVYDETVTQAVYNIFTYKGIEYQPTFYKYDKRGLVTEVEDAEGKVKVFEYDANGNLIQTTDKDGYTTTYEYDPLNMMKKINYNGEKQVEFQYNPLGQLTEMKDWLGVTKFDLDPLGRILEVTDFENKTTKYTWTNTGEKESITYPDGSEVNYQYDNLGRLTEVQDAIGKVTEYSYDEIGNLTERILPNGSQTQYMYDAISNIKEQKEIDPQGRTIDAMHYEYDRAGNTTRIYKNKSDLDEEAEEGEDREGIAYRYDALNQLIEVTKNNGETRKYFYDSLGNRIRMEEWNIEGIEDAVNYEYDVLNRLTSTYEDIEEDGGKQYKYDNRGNLTQIRSGDKIFNKYEFDETNSLVKVINKHGDQTKYTYDGFGNRIKTTIDLKHPGGGNRPDKDDKGNNGNAYGHDKDNPGDAYGHDKDNPGNAYGHDKDKGNPKPGWKHQNKRQQMEQNFVVDITSPYNNVLMIYGDHYQVQRYTYGIDRISMDMNMLDDYDNGWIPSERDTHRKESSERLYYLHDELGSTTKVIGEDGKTSAHYNYDEFGRPLSARKFDQNWPGPDNTFGYTGYQYDASSELYYAQARYYSPEIGRFISEDPWAGTIVEPNTQNPYPYVLNNPLKYVDPMGLVQKNIENEGGVATKPGKRLPARSETPTNPVDVVREKVEKDKTKADTCGGTEKVNVADVGKAIVVGSTVDGNFAPTTSEGIYVELGPKAMDAGTSLLKESFPTILFLKIIFTPSRAGETDEELRQWHIDMSKAKGKEGNDSSEEAGNAGKTVFPKNPADFNPSGLIKKEYNNGKIIKWQDPKTGKSVYEWNADAKYGNHYHYTPDGKNRAVHPDTGDTHINPGDSVPK